MLKKCSRCKEEKELDAFCVKRKSKDGRNPFCRECNKKYHQEHYRQNREVYLEKERQRRHEFFNWLRALKNSLKCEKCGEDHPACLDFHHKDPSKKDFTISQMKSFSKERILEEIAKCHVWCCKCHRMWHWKYGPIV